MLTSKVGECMGIKIKRAGVTARYWSGNGWDERLSADQKQKTVDIKFHIAAKGGGTTVISVEIDGGSFEELARLMISANREKAIKAFGLALSGS